MLFLVEQAFVGRTKYELPENACVGGYDTDSSEEKIRVLPAGVETTTFWLLVQILYH